jgi:hypothetical protein
MVSLAEIRARNVQPVWQEAVAVVQELIQSSTATGTPLPDLEHVALIPNGDVVAMPGSPESADPVRLAATMLRVLVDGTATPPELEEFVRKNLSSAAAPTLEDFSRGLSFYERPGRRSDVERLVSRAAAAEQMTRADVELRKLKEKATEASDSRLEDTVFMDTVAMSGRRRQPIAAIAAAALLVVVVGGAWWWWRNRTSAPQRSASASASAAGAATADKPVAASADKSASAGSSSAGASALAASPSASNAGAPAPRTGAATQDKPAAATANKSAALPGNSGAGASAPATAPSGSPASTSAPPTGAPTSPSAASNAPVAPGAHDASLYDRAKAAVQSAVNSIVGPAPAPEHAAVPAPPVPAPATSKKVHHKKPLPVPPPVPPGTPVAVAVDVPAPVVSSTAAAPQYDALPVAHDDMVYTTTDAAVIPPVLVRPVLPKYPPPGLAEDQIGSIEVLVDEQGDVDQVRLISPANRFHERMLMSAAKTWKFRPAFKDGHPVRYRTRIRVTL